MFLNLDKDTKNKAHLKEVKGESLKVKGFIA
jgi:hypothetical protein